MPHDMPLGNGNLLVVLRWFLYSSFVPMRICHKHRQDGLQGPATLHQPLCNCHFRNHQRSLLTVFHSFIGSHGQSVIHRAPIT